MTLSALGPTGFVGVLLASAACGPSVRDDDGGGDGDGGGSVSESDPTASTTVRDDGSGTRASMSAGASLSGAAGTSTGASPMGSTGTASTTGTVSLECADQAAGECTQIDDCENVSGSGVRKGDTGEFSCSDLAVPFACAPTDCMRFSGILCASDSGAMRWVIEQCIPDGWAPCPSAECGVVGP